MLDQCWNVLVTALQEAATRALLEVYTQQRISCWHGPRAAAAAPRCDAAQAHSIAPSAVQGPPSTALAAAADAAVARPASCPELAAPPALPLPCAVHPILQQWPAGRCTSAADSRHCHRRTPRPMTKQHVHGTMCLPLKARQLSLPAPERCPTGAGGTSAHKTSVAWHTEQGLQLTPSGPGCNTSTTSCTDRSKDLRKHNSAVERQQRAAQPAVATPAAPAALTWLPAVTAAARCLRVAELHQISYRFGLACPGRWLEDTMGANA